MKRGRYARLKWVKPKLPKTVDASLATLVASPTGQALRLAASTFGFPRAEKPTNVRGQAIELLQAAAEIEQALLTQYLYAAYSIDPAGPASDLRDIVIQIAIEEMGHLITVQNLLLALYGDLWFNRENVPLNGKPGGDYPFPLRFEPFSGDSLAKYVTTECMPLKAIQNPDLQKKLKPIFQRADGAAGAVQHVGLLYAKLFWLFQPNDAPHPYWPDVPKDMLPADWHLKDTDLKRLDNPRQVQAAEFGQEPATPSNPDPGGLGHHVYVIQINSRDQALFALAQIARQGEGYQPGFDSHFARFLKAYDDFAASFPAGVRSVPDCPNTSAKPLTNAQAEAGRITHPKALRWAKLFNVRYQFLLLELWLGVSTDSSTTGALGRDALFSSAISEMSGRISRIADRLLPTMDRKDQNNQDRKAGAPFELPDAALPDTEKSVKARMKALLNEAESLAVEIENLPAPNAPSTAERGALTAMRNADQPLKAALGA
jgi:hypothetical protein